MIEGSTSCIWSWTSPTSKTPIRSQMLLERNNQNVPFLQQRHWTANVNWNQTSLAQSSFGFSEENLSGKFFWRLGSKWQSGIDGQGERTKHTCLYQRKRRVIHYIELNYNARQSTQQPFIYLEVTPLQRPWLAYSSHWLCGLNRKS